MSEPPERLLDEPLSDAEREEVDRYAAALSDRLDVENPEQKARRAALLHIRAHRANGASIKILAEATENPDEVDTAVVAEAMQESNEASKRLREYLNQIDAYPHGSDA